MFGSANHQITPTVAGFIKTIMRCGAILIRASSSPSASRRLHFLPRTPPDRRKSRGTYAGIQRRFLLRLNGQVWQFLETKLAFAAFVGKCSVFSCTRGHFSALRRARPPAARAIVVATGAHRIDAAILKTRQRVSLETSALVSRSPVFTSKVLAGK